VQATAEPVAVGRSSSAQAEATLGSAAMYRKADAYLMQSGPVDLNHHGLRLLGQQVYHAAVQIGERLVNRMSEAEDVDVETARHVVVGFAVDDRVNFHGMLDLAVEVGNRCSHRYSAIS
jgi:hypothetical protein